MTTFELRYSDFRRQMRRLVPFMARCENRYFLNGVYFEWTGEELLATATDGHRLCSLKLACISGEEHPLPQAPVSFIYPGEVLERVLEMLPKKTASNQLLLSISGHEDGQEAEGLFKRTVAIQWDGVTSITTREINGTYPNYRKVIEACPPESALPSASAVNARYLRDALKCFDDGIGLEIRHNPNDDLDKSPVLFSSREQDGMRCVIMPMRLSPF